jgi:hypothetical protein
VFSREPQESVDTHRYTLLKGDFRPTPDYARQTEDLLNNSFEVLVIASDNPA